MMQRRLRPFSRSAAGGRVLVQPPAEHYRNPHHFAVVAGKAGRWVENSHAHEILAQDVAFDQYVEGFPRELVEALVLEHPVAIRQAEVLFLLGDDLGRQKSFRASLKNQRSCKP